MVISANQVNNALRVYGDQLRRSIASLKGKGRLAGSRDTVDISPGAKRKAAIGRIASRILERIARHNPQEEAAEDVFKQVQSELGIQLNVTKKGPTELIVKVTDLSGETTSWLYTEDSRSLRYEVKEIGAEEPEKTGTERGGFDDEG